MNHNRLRRQCSITADSQRVAVLVKTGVAVGTQWRCIDCDVPNAITTSDRSIFHEEDENTMATTVAMLERYQQPTTVAVTPNSVSDVDRSFHGHRHRHHQVLQDGYPRSHRTKYNSVSAGSALSKSMRYADGWLYERDAGGTVGHGRSDRNKARSTFLGRDHFGVPAASTMAAKNTKNISAATTATTTPQPSLTNEDPYDRVRKNRMSGMTTPAVLTANMDRKRNRSNESSRTPSPDYDDSGGYGHVNSPSRRSILECNVNPYDLVSRQPSDCDENDDENNCPKRMSLKDKFMNRIQDTVFTKNGRATCNGVGSRFGSFSSNGSAKKTTTDRNNGVGVNIAGHTVRLSDGKSLVNNKSPSSVWYDDGSASDAATIEVKNQSPVRPPRRRCKPLATTIPSGGHSGMAKRSHSLTTGAMSFVSAAEIKSILKKPVSLTTDDLSPVRSRTPIAQSTASPVTTSSGPCNGIAQKKTKKQVQFDIVSVKTAEKCTTDDDHCTKTLLTEENTSSSMLAPKSTNQNSTDTDSVVISVPERKLKRSLSDRQNSNNAIRTENVKVFNDTMRIHVRHKNRPDSRAAFERPAEPPPPPPSPPPSPSLTMTSSPATTTMKIATPLTTDDSTASITELFSCGNVDVYDEPNKTVVQVSSENSSADDGRDISTIVEPEQKTSILINSSPGLKTSVIIGEGGSAYAASADNKVTISIGPTKCPATRGVGGRSGGNYRSNVTVVDRTDSRMSDFIRMNYDPVQAARLNVTPHVCGRSASTNTIATNDGYAPKPLVSPYRVSEIAAKHLTAGVHPTSSDETESSSESCYTSAKEDASYSSASLSSASSSASSFSSSSTTNDGNCMCPSLHYEVEPIYEEISESPTPPPLPSCPPPDRTEHESAATAGLPSRSIFEGATKYDIINYLVDAKRRCGGLHDTSGGLHDTSGVLSKFVVVNDEQAIVASLDGNGTCCSTDSSGEDYGTTVATITETTLHRSDAEVKKASVDIERNDSGVGSETSQSSRSRWQQQQQHETQHSCEDCDQPVEIQTTDSGIVFAPLVCRKCHKRRAERREIVAEIVETEEKYGRDLDIIAEEFYRPMMVAGLLNADQLTSVFLNVSELKEHSAALSRRLRDAYEIAVEQGDDDLLTVNIGRLFLEASPSMLHAFQSYCTRQGNAALLLANLEKEKELLRIFLRVSQMENAVLRRMNLNSFLMVPVQRVTKYPLLLARLYKVTPEHHLEARQTLNEARHKIQLHLEHINSLAKDISSTKLWRKIYAINGKRPDNEDLADIKFRKVAVDVLEWSGLGEEIRFAMEGRLLYTQPSDHNWRRGGRTIKLMPINAIIVTLGKPNDNYNPDADDMAFPKQNGIRDASLVLLKEKSGRISLLREPMYLDRCVVCCENDCDDYFELHEITTKETYILKCQDSEQTKMWYRQLQYHCQTLGCWRKRRNAFANIMINRNCT